MVPIGTPITSEQAALAVLRLVRSPLLLDCETAKPRTVVDHAVGPDVWPSLSGGERALVTIANSFLRPRAELFTARLSVLGSLDKDNRRKVLMVLWYLHMGHDVPISELADAQFIELFGVPEKLR